jgi:hypothetical protein
LASVFGFSHAGGEAPMLDVIEKTARHLGEMHFVPDAQRVGNNHPPLRAVFRQTDARISRLQRGHSVFEGNGDIGGRHARAGPMVRIRFPPAGSLVRT